MRAKWCNRTRMVLKCARGKRDRRASRAPFRRSESRRRRVDLSRALWAQSVISGWGRERRKSLRRPATLLMSSTFRGSQQWIQNL